VVIDPSRLYWKNAEGSVLASDNLFLGTEGIIVPSGTTLQRPGSPVNGTFRYNSDNHAVEIYQNGGWTTSVGSVLGTANQIVATTVFSTTTFSIALNPVIPGTIGMVIPVGNNADETGIIDGMIRYNSDTKQFRGRVNGAWQNITDNFFLNPMTTRGDILRAAVGGTPTRLAIGAPNTFLISNGTDPSWGVPTNLDNVIIGATGPVAGTFTTLTSTGQANLAGAGESNGLRVLTRASSDTYLTVQGATAAQDIIVAAAGAQANMAVQWRTLGSGAHKFMTSGTVVQAQILDTAGATRWLTFTGSNGANPTIGTSAGALSLSPAGNIVQITNASTNPILFFNRADQAADQKNWGMSNVGADFSLYAENDAINANTIAYTIARGTTYNIASHTWKTSTVAGTAQQGMQLSTTQLLITPSASTDGVTVAGGTGTVTISASGGSTNVNLQLQSKGTNAVNLATGGGVQAQIIDTATANRFLIFTGANSADPTINVSAGALRLSPTTVIGGASISTTATSLLFNYGDTSFVGGDRAHMFNSYFQSGWKAASTTGFGGYIKNLNASGDFEFGTIGWNITGTLSATVTPVLQKKVLHTDSAVNYLAMTGGATNIGPFLTSLGSDTNVDLKLVTKGTQSISFGTNNNPWSLSTAFYESRSFSVTSQDATPTAFFFKSDGSKFYMTGTGSGTKTVYQYSLSTPYRISSASYDTVSISINAQTTTPDDIFFKPDGTKMFVLGGNTIYRYNLSTPWVLTGATYDSISFSTAGQDTLSKAMFFRPDGLKMYVVGNTGHAIYQYTLSSAWDVSTATYDTVSLSITSQDSSAVGIFMRPEGTKLFILGGTNKTVYQYTLSTPWVLTGGSYDSVSLSVTAQDATSQAMQFNPSGTRLYYAGSTSASIYQYVLSNTVQAQVLNTSSAVNFLTLAGSTTTNKAAITVDGADTNIGITIGGKGTGETLVTKGNYKDNRATENALGSITGSNNVDLALGNVITATSTGNLTLVFGTNSSYAASGTFQSWLIMVNVSTFTLTLQRSAGNAVTWDQNGVPTFTASKRAVVQLWTDDGGATVYATFIGSF
jgi:hypothetical protein